MKDQEFLMWLHEWFVIDSANGDKILRGPFQSQEAAGITREAMELGATDAQNEAWNLWIKMI